ncbi:MAG: galactosyltransferase [Alphaproteobacteria bacterium]|nr:galactosyltransferase [Alphaproteobacteria bacterium]
MTSLAIVIPYRDREAHFRTLFPRLSAYLRQRHPGLDFRIHLIEQAAGKPFNRGKLCNVGFALASEQYAQVCFHDVDYVPVDADYAPVAGPTRLIWYGAHLQHRYDLYFGGVVAFPNADFERVNGFSNEFWGWGFEDSELRQRCVAAGLEIRYRDGTFEALPHAHQGFGPAGALNVTAERNRGLLKSRWRRLATGEAQRHDGLTSLRFRVASRHRLSLRDAPEALHVTVEI